MIQAEGLTKFYGPRKAIEDVTFQVPDGKIVGFLGPNGAGKTTTMRILTGYLRPDRGSVRIGEFDLRQRPADAKRLIGYMPENPPIYPEMRVREFLAFLAEVKQVPRKKRKERLEWTITHIGLEEVVDRVVGRLSKGYRQRVGLASALIHDPQVLILDEPTAGLDPIQIAETREIIRHLGKERTILLSSHILEEVTKVCQEAIIIHKGQILASGSIEELGRVLTPIQKLHVRVARRKGEFVEKLRQMGLEVSSTDGAVLVKAAPGNDMREQVADIAVREGFGLLELYEEKPSLEEIFLTLTKK